MAAQPSASSSAPKTTPGVFESHIDVPCRDTFLPGTLAQVDPERRSSDVALILHGQMAHRNQIYHKKLVTALATRRGLDSFRFDFAHAKYNQPGWDWHMAQIPRDVEELRTVVAYLQQELGYRVKLLVGHSKGALASFLHLKDAADPPQFYVNLSGRHDMKRAHHIMGPNYYPAFESHGYYEWKAKAAGQQIAVKITPAQFQEFLNHDTSFVSSPSYAPSTHVLTIHGTADAVVPIDDGRRYHSILSQRVPPEGQTKVTSELKVLEDADHNFLGRYDEVVEAILEWLERVDKGEAGAAEVDSPQSPKGKL